MKKSRKTHVIGLIFSLILILACIVTVNMGEHGRRDDTGPARYIFLFIGDGMGATHVAATESYLSYLDGEKGFRQLSFTEFPVLGMTTTYSADRNVTCSSAAGTAISCGEKTVNGRLGISPQGDTLVSIAKILRDKGYKIGILSSVPVNHATPASFYGHNTDRYDYYGITREIPSSGYDFFAGSGFIDYAGKSGDEESSRSILEKAGYRLCFGREDFEACLADGPEKIILCQESGRDKSVSDYMVEKAPDTDMTPSEIMKNCLKALGDKDPFFIMYEEGEIDWAAHENKTMPLVESVRKLDDAVRTAVDFYREHPDETLIIVTADHETGGIALGATKTWGEVNLGWNILDSAWTASGYANTLDYDENRAMNDRAFIGWTTRGHTGGPVPVYAIGKGAERFSGRFDNTDIKGKLLAE